MPVVVELWKARQVWFELSLLERSAYLENFAPAIRRLLVNGAELIALGVAEETRRLVDYDYWAIWRFPDEEHLVDFNRAIESGGWHDYFERVNLGVEALAIEDIPLPREICLNDSTQPPTRSGAATARLASGFGEIAP